MIDLMNQLPTLSFVSIQALSELLIKGFLICCAGHFFVSEMSMHPAAVRHRIATGTFVVLALLPIAAIFTPALSIKVLPSGGNINSSWNTLLNLLLWMYFAIVIVLSLRLLTQILRTGFISALSSPACRDWPLEQRKQIRLSKHIHSPLTWGTLKPYILFPTASAEWAEAERRMALQHELSHIDRGDWMTMLLARWVCILFWPVPGIRRLLTAVSLSAEQACDDRVIKGGYPETDYADLLIKLARNENLEASVALAQATGLDVRVRYLVAEIVDRSTLDPLRRWVYPMCILLALPLSAVTLEKLPRQSIVVPLQRPQLPELNPIIVTAQPLRGHILSPLRPAEVIRPPDAKGLLRNWQDPDTNISPQQLRQDQ